jgi:hypothetical protein
MSRPSKMTFATRDALATALWTAYQTAAARDPENKGLHYARYCETQAKLAEVK